MLKLLSWNIQQGGGSRVKSILQFLAQQAAHIIVLSEFRNNKNGAFIRTKLLEKGYHFQFVSLAGSEVNSVLIASKIPASSRLFVDRKEDFDHSIICAEFAAFRCFGVYLPHKKKHKLFDILHQEVQHAKPSIIAGDFNTGINHVDQKGSSFWSTDELKKFEELKVHDAFRHVHGQVESYSWYSHQGNGYRYDHTYIHNDLLPLIKNCDYIHDAREKKYSDHSPMLLEL